MADYLSRLPKHWKPQDNRPNEIEVWFVGQKRKLDRELELLAAELAELRRAIPGAVSPHETLPDFARMDCYACHHTIKNSPRVATSENAHPLGTPSLGSGFDLFFDTIDLDESSVDVWKTIQRAGLGAAMPSVTSIETLRAKLADITPPTTEQFRSSLRTADVSAGWDSARGWWHGWSAYDRSRLATSDTDAVRQRLQYHFKSREYPRRNRTHLEVILSPVDFDIPSFLADRKTAVSP